MKEDVRSHLFRKLKEENCFWSYDVSKMDEISDEALIEHVLLYLDLDDIDKLFPLFGYKKVKRVWLDRVAPQGEMFRRYNILYAWYYFGAKRPKAYVKSLETRYINRLFAKENGYKELLPHYHASDFDILEYAKEQILGIQ